MELCHRNFDILERVLNRIVLSNSTAWEVHTHASYKTRTWKNFDNRGTKLILLSDELMIANDSNSFANGSKSVMRNNLCLCKRSEIYLI